MKANLTQNIEELEQLELLMKMEPFLHDKLMLHLLKKTQGKFINKEFLFLTDGTVKYYQLYQNMQQDNSKILDWSGIPDAIVYDTADNTYMAIQYCHIGQYNVRDILDANFPNKYNNTTHVMNITVNDEQDFETIYQIIKQHKSKFDIKIQTQYTNVYTDANLITILKEMDQLTIEFMEKHGSQIRNSFYLDFYNQDYSKFKYDAIFVKEFYEFVKNYAAGDNVSEWIPATEY